MEKFGIDGMLSPDKEKEGVLGHEDNTKRRPGDVTFPQWHRNKGLAVDVAVICPLAPTNMINMANDNPCEAYII